MPRAGEPYGVNMLCLYNVSNASNNEAWVILSFGLNLGPGFRKDRRRRAVKIVYEGV
jgi:hypothetical protein